MIAHKDLYIILDHCTACGQVPLYEGHKCGESICPRCKKPVGSDRDHLDAGACPDCPLCFYCHIEVQIDQVEAFRRAAGTTNEQADA